MAFHQGRSKRGREAYSVQYVERPSDARTTLEAFFNRRARSYQKTFG
jgi:hypothetical protein